MLQIPTCCFEGGRPRLVMAVFMIRTGAVAGCIGMLFAFGGETVLLVTHFVAVMINWRDFRDFSDFRQLRTVLISNTVVVCLVI